MILKVLEKIRTNKRLEMTDDWPTSLAEFIKRCWHHNPACRPQFKVKFELSSDIYVYVYILRDLFLQTQLRYVC